MKLKLVYLMVLALLCTCAFAENPLGVWDEVQRAQEEPQDDGDDVGWGAAWGGNAQQNRADVDMYEADLKIAYVTQGGAPLSPFLTTEADLVNLNQLVFESLVTLDESQRPVPMLADNWTHDGTRWTFTLRSGILFHNGVEMTARDVKATYDAFMRTAQTGANPYEARIRRFIVDLQEVDSRTIEVEAVYEGYITLYAMTFPIAQADTVYDAQPRGTGPYLYVDYLQDSAVRLDVNPLWWQRTPTIPTIAFRHYPDSGTAIQALQTGQVDMLSTRSSNAAICRKLANLTSLDYTTTQYEMLLPNLNSGSSLSDLAVRRAVMYAIDRSTLAGSAYLDMAVQSEVPVMPGTWLYESQSAQYYYSPERALQLLYDDGWRDLTGNLVLNKLSGVKLQELSVRLITYNESTTSIRENAANQIAENLRAVGIKVTVSVYSKDTVSDRIKKGNYDLALIGINLSEVPMVYSMLVSRGVLNYNDYRDSEMDRLAEWTLSAADDETMRTAYSQIQLKVVEDLPIMGLLYRTGTVLSTRSLGRLSGLRGMNALRGLWYLNEDG